MVSTPARSLTVLWPPDDSEESILGVDRHQLDIFSLRAGLNEEALRLAGAGPRPWQAITQIMLLGCRRPDGSLYTVYPDVMVFPRPMDQSRGSYSLAQDGPPVLVVEVASEATVAADLDVRRGKGWSYAHAGVRDYLVLDPPGTLVPTLGRGWRLVDGMYRSWEPDAAGRWHSQVLPVAFGVEDGLAAVYTREGRRHLREGEVDAALEAQRHEGREEGRHEGREEGRAAGHLEGTLAGKRETLRRLARLRFGVLPALEQRLDSAGEDDLDRLLERLLTVTDPTDL
jgi:hypothetical protein